MANTKETGSSKVFSTESVLLSFNDDKVTNNYAPWLKATRSKMSQVYKKQMTVMNPPYQKYVPSPEPDKECRKGITSKTILEALDTDFHRQRQKEFAALEQNAAPFMNSLIDSLSPASQRLIASHGSFEKAFLDGNPNRVFEIIREMFFTKVGGTGKNSITLKMAVEKGWNEFCQKAEWDVDFYLEQFMEWMEKREAWGFTAYTAAEQAQYFIVRLDPSRYMDHQVQMLNDSILESTYPDSLFKAQLLANNWVAAVAKGGADGEQRSFMLCGTVRSTPTDMQKQVMIANGSTAPQTNKARRSRRVL
jgi:hypothetical protein